MTQYHLDTETFIKVVKKHPEIWNKKSAKHKPKIQLAWTEIAKLFIVDYENMTELEHKDVCRKLQGRWRNIRDNYVRHIRGNSRVARGGYIYAKQLDFLEDIYKNDESGSDAECDNVEQSDDDEKPPNLKTGKSNELVPDMWADSDTNEAPSTIENFKRKRSSTLENSTSNTEFVEPPFVATTIGYGGVGDDDRAFFESLIPAVTEFDMDQKLEFRSEVLNLIKNIRSAKRRMTHN